MSDAPRPVPPDPVRGVFLADLAHDLSTPLTAIHGAIELLLAGAYGSLDGEQRALMVEVLASAREMRAIVQDVADLGAIDGGRLAFGSTRVDVGAILDELRASLGEAAAKRGVTFTLDAPPAGTAIASDDRRLRQIFACVFGYAVKAASRGFARSNTRAASAGFTAAIDGKVKWQLIDNAGRIVAHNSIAAKRGNNNVVINLNRLSTGTYFLIVSGANIDQKIKLEKL